MAQNGRISATRGRYATPGNRVAIVASLVSVKPTANRTMGQIIAARFSRCGFLKGLMAATAITTTVSPLAMLAAGDAKAQAVGSVLDFPEVTASIDADLCHSQILVDCKRGTSHFGVWFRAACA